MNRVMKLVAVILACSLLLSACSSPNANIDSTSVLPSTESNTKVSAEETAGNEATENSISSIEETEREENVADEEVPDFYGLNDPALLQYVEDKVYVELVNEFESEDYVIENVEAIYYSDDYLQELAFNSKSNIFFGYTLAELDEQFQGERYVFTLGDDGKTVVVPFEDYDDTYEKVIKNVAIGTGVILICVTVSVVSGGTGATPISVIFAAAAKNGTIMALSAGGIGALAAGTITGIQTHDMEKALKAAALQGSESFKWGAIIGTLTGGLKEANSLRKGAKTAQELADNADDASNLLEEALGDPNTPEWRKAELRALKEYGGNEQLSYIAGEEVPISTPGATRPDIVRTVGNHLEAIEVKYYNLESSASLNTLYSELEREVSARVINLPANSTQRVVLDVTGRSFSSETISTVIETIQSKLFSIYGSNIPIDIVGL